jgi:hypothetical protein
MQDLFDGSDDLEGLGQCAWMARLEAQLGELGFCGVASLSMQ